MYYMKDIQPYRL